MAEQKDNTGMYLIAAGVGVLFLWDKIFGKSEEEKKLDTEEKKLDDKPPAANPTTNVFTQGKIPKGTIAIRTTKTKPAVPPDYFSKAVVALKLAFGTFTDDETAIVAAIKRAATKSELNLMFKIYNLLYKRDLMYDLANNLNAKERLPIITYINKLPEYIKGTK